MPSGAYVEVIAHSTWMQVYMHALPEDAGKSSGLCGNFNGKSADDFKVKDTNKIIDERQPFPREFSESYRSELMYYSIFVMSIRVLVLYGREGGLLDL